MNTITKKPKASAMVTDFHRESAKGAHYSHNEPLMEKYNVADQKLSGMFEIKLVPGAENLKTSLIRDLVILLAREEFTLQQSAWKFGCSIRWIRTFINKEFGNEK